MYKCMRMRVYKRMCMCICTWHTREGGGTGRLFNASAAAVADDRAVDLWTDRLIPNTATAALHAFHLACFMQGLGPILSCEVLTR